MIESMSTRRSSVGVGVVGEQLYAVGGYDGSCRQCLNSYVYFANYISIMVNLMRLTQLWAFQYVLYTYMNRPLFSYYLMSNSIHICTYEKLLKTNVTNDIN